MSDRSSAIGDPGRLATARLARRIQGIPPSGIRRFFDIAATMDDVISLGIGEPDFVTPEPILAAGLRSLGAGETHYTSNSGLLELRQALAAHLKRLYGLSYDPETEILITVGVSEALHLALLAVIEAGDEVIIPEPCFVAYGPDVTLAGGTAVFVPTRARDQWQVTVESIEAHRTDRTTALLIGYPNNPTGAVLSPERQAELARYAEAHDLLVLSDEIYDRLVYGAPHFSFASLPGMGERTVLLGGFSKDYAMTGWRVGYVCAPAPILAGIRKIHQYIIMSAPTTAQHAALYALQHGEEHVEAMRLQYDRRRRLIVAGLNDLGLGCSEPRGAFYAFPDVRSTGLDSETFAQRLLQEERVAVVPGDAFGASGAGYVRCSYATAEDQIEEALARMERFLGRL